MSTRGEELLRRAMDHARAQAPNAAQASRLAQALGVAPPPPPLPVTPAASAVPAVAGASVLVAVVCVSVWAVWPTPAPRSTASAPRMHVQPDAPLPIEAAPSLAEPIVAPAPAQPRIEAPPPRLAPRAARATFDRVRPASPLPEPVVAETPSPEPAAQSAGLASPGAEGSGSRVREEAALIQRAETGLATDPTLALRLADEHGDRFATGMLSEEREVIAIDALLRLGQRDRAEQRARAFERVHPRSIHLRRVRALLAAP